jgi:hypothetical protein
MLCGEVRRNIHMKQIVTIVVTEAEKRIVVNIDRVDWGAAVC